MLIEKKTKSCLTQAQVARAYSVSPPTASKWFEEALKGDNKISLFRSGSKYLAVDTASNHAEFERLKARALRFRNKIGYESVKPNKDLYKHLTETEIIDLIYNLEKKRLPTKFAHIGKAADYWDKYIRFKEATSHYEGVEILNANLENIYLHLRKYDSVNIFEIGPTNGVNSFKIISFLKSKNLKLTYTSFESSERMVEILEFNFKSNFKDISFDTYGVDIETTTFKDILFNKKINSGDNSVNLVLCLDYFIGSSYNIEYVLKNLQYSMDPEDFLLLNAGLHNPKRLEYLHNHFENRYVKQRIFEFPRLLGLKKDYYTIKNDKSESEKQFCHYLKFKKDIDLVFKIKEKEKIVSFKNRDELRINMVYSFEIGEIFDYCKKIFSIELLTTSEFAEEILLLLKDN